MCPVFQRSIFEISSYFFYSRESFIYILQYYRLLIIFTLLLPLYHRYITFTMTKYRRAICHLAHYTAISSLPIVKHIGDMQGERGARVTEGGKDCGDGKLAAVHIRKASNMSTELCSWKLDQVFIFKHLFQAG